MSDTIVLSPAGKKKLQEELEDLKRNKRKQVAERISTAKEFGDLSENAEYHEAKEEQAFIEGRIIELEHVLKVAEVADSADSKTITVGSKVVLKKNSQPLELEVVGATEANPAEGKISLESPLGQALLGREVGEVFELETPGGINHYIVESIK
jgi:transcription elongation factor GreA